MFDNSILVELQDLGDISVDIGDVKTVVVPEKKVPQAIPRITVDANGLITATSNQESGSVVGGTEKSTYQLAVENGKTVYPSENQQIIVKKNTYSLGDIILEKVSSEEKTVDVTDDGNYEISPSYGKLLSKVFVNVDTSQKRKEAFEAGKKAEHKTFWYAFFLDRDTFAYAFCEWRGEMFKPNADIIFQNSVNSADYTFQNAKYFDLKERTVDKGFAFDTSQAKRLAGTFHSTCIGNIPTIDLSSCTQLIRTFYFMQRDTLHDGLYTTKEINIVNLRSDCTFDNAFSYIYGLERLIINGTIGQNGFNVQWSTLLDKASHISIMTALSTTTSGLTVTFSKTAVDKAFETSSGANDGSTSPEWLALVATRPNVTIALA